ncbi:uncharacterized protein LOC133519520 [Cydia pomonella]|uniref:uncharacterized protein LOC133519520 n=1 Tax=Cydia pomonella TaxID=82600 RepID=UPI002ADDD43B|nr:uncharacterized protein LOC133519520 [Cydia pomonella]
MLVMQILIIKAASSPAQSKILEETNSNDGSVTFIRYYTEIFAYNSFKTSNGLTRNEIGTVKNGQKHHVKGSYSYTDPDGNDVVVHYKSDENGYVTVDDVTSEATETPPKAPLAKIPSIVLSHQLKVPPFVWFRQPVISPFVMFHQLGIPIMLFPQLAKKTALPSYQEISSAVQTHNLETLTAMPVIKPKEKPHVPSDPGQIPANVPDRITHVPSYPVHPGKIPTTVLDSKLHNQTIPFVPYNYDDIIDVPNRQSEVTQEVGLLNNYKAYFRVFSGWVKKNSSIYF